MPSTYPITRQSFGPAMLAPRAVRKYPPSPYPTSFLRFHCSVHTGPLQTRGLRREKQIPPKFICSFPQKACTKSPTDFRAFFAFSGFDRDCASLA